MSLLVPVTTAFSGAFVGAVLAYWLQRARPRINLDSVKTSIEYPDDRRSAASNQELIERLNDYERQLGDFEILRGRLTEKIYVKLLAECQQALDDEIRTFLSCNKPLLAAINKAT
jgi:hypothetical protein